MEKAVFQMGAFHFNMLCKLEAALKAASCNATMEIGHIFRLGAAASNGKHILLYLDLKIGFAKTCDRHRNAIPVLAGSLDIVGRIAEARVARHGIEQRLELIKANGRTVKGGKIEIPHISHPLQAMFLACGKRVMPPMAGYSLPRRTRLRRPAGHIWEFPVQASRGYKCPSGPLTAPTPSRIRGGRDMMRSLVTGLALLLVAAFGGAASAEETGVIKLGAAVSLTGKYSSNGQFTKNGYDLAAKLINEAGGVKVGDKSYRIEIIYYDDESTPARGAQLVERLIQQDGV